MSSTKISAQNHDRDSDFKPKGGALSVILSNSPYLTTTARDLVQAKPHSQLEKVPSSSFRNQLIEII
jgi:hypothetical protein